MKTLSLIATLLVAQATSLALYCPDSCKCSSDPNQIKISDCSEPLNLSKPFSEHSNHIVQVVIDNVTLVDVNKTAFTVFTNLERLAIEHSKILKMDPDLVNALEIDTLSFAGSTFKTLPYITSLDLEEIMLSNCHLGKMPNFDQATYVSVLHLDGNDLGRVERKQFELLESLEEINLSNNKISSIPKDIFVNNTELKNVILDNNPLNVFRIGYNKLEALSLASCGLMYFDDAFLEPSNTLEKLNLTNNMLSLITKDTLANFPILKYLYLGGNRLIQLDADVFENTPLLDKIVLDGNKLVTLPVFVGKNERQFETYYFSCNNCGLKVLSKDTFANMNTLVELHLNGNNLKNIDNAFTSLSTLTELDLSGNKIGKIGVNAFNGNPKLLRINLSNNPLTTLNPEVFVQLKSLVKIVAINTGMAQLWSSYKYQLSVEQLQISNNSLTRVSEEDLEVTPKLKFLDVDNNPLECDSSLETAMKWVIKKRVYSKEGSDLLKTHERMIGLLSDTESLDVTYDHVKHWKEMATKMCMTTPKNIDEKELRKRGRIIHEIRSQTYEPVDKDAPKMVEAPEVVTAAKQVDELIIETTESDDAYDEDEDYDDYATKEYPNPSEVLLNRENAIVLSEASYYMSVSFVFITTAVLVLVIVATTLICILKRRQVLNNDNLPRIKIMRWGDNPFLHKKHSGTVYRPLSEENIAPSKYTFTTIPVGSHSSQ